MCTIAAKTDKAFRAFLDDRNPTKQHSSTLESYLIKPVQRVLKYPLLLRELVSLTDQDSEEHYHLTGEQEGHEATRRPPGGREATELPAPHSNTCVCAMAVHRR